MGGNCYIDENYTIKWMIAKGNRIAIDLLREGKYVKTIAADATETVTNSSELEAGPHASFKFIFEPCEKTFVYFYHFSENGVLSMMFPYDTGFRNGQYDAGLWYDIPRGYPIWFPIPEGITGIGTYYLLASRDRLTQLEKLTVKLEAARGSGEGREKAQKDILDEIALLKQETVSDSTVEKPVPIMGTVKSGATDLCDEVSGVSFYAKVISVKPQNPR